MLGTQIALRALMVMAGLVFAAGLHAADEAQQATGALLRLTGIQDQINEIPAVIHDGIEQRRSERVALVGIGYDELERILAGHYSAEKLTGMVIERIGAQYDPNRFALLAEMLADPTLQRIRQLKAQAMRPEAFAAIERFAAQQKQQPADEGRVALVDALDNAAAESELFAGTQALGVLAILEAVQPATPSEEQSIRLGEQMLARLHSEFQEPSRYTVRMTNLYALQEVSDEDLSQSIATFREHVVQWFIQLTFDALIESMLEVNGQARKAIEERIAAGT